MYLIGEIVDGKQKAVRLKVDGEHSNYACYFISNPSLVPFGATHGLFNVEPADQFAHYVDLNKVNHIVFK